MKGGIAKPHGDDAKRKERKLTFQEVPDPLEFESLVEAFGGRSDLVKELVADFVKQGREFLMTLKENCGQEGSSDMFYKSAHSFKGVCASMKASDLAILTKELCDLARYSPEDTAGKGALLTKIQDEFRKVEMYASFIVPSSVDTAVVESHYALLPSPIDYNSLVEIMSGNEQMVRDLLKRWVSDTSVLIENARAFFEPNSDVTWESFGASVHSLKGTCGAANAKKMYYIALQLNYVVKYQPTRMDELRSLWQQIETEFDIVEDYVNEIVNSRYSHFRSSKAQIWTDVPPADYEALLKDMGGDAQCLASIVDDFVASATARTQALQRAIHEKCQVGVWKEAHQLSADTGYMHAPKLYEYASSLAASTDAESGEFAKFYQLLQLTEKELNNFAAYWDNQRHLYVKDD